MANDAPEILVVAAEGRPVLGERIQAELSAMGFEVRFETAQSSEMTPEALTRRAASAAWP